MMAKREIEEIKTKWWNQVPTVENCDSFQTKFDGLRINDVGGVFLFVLLGIVLACLMLAFEYFWYKNNRLKLLASNIVLYGRACDILTSHNVASCDAGPSIQGRASFARWNQLISVLRQKR